MLQGTSPLKRGQKIAVVGSGVSGLGAAWLLSPHYEVALFEATGRIGGHALTVSVNRNDMEIPVDIGFIVFNKVNYPNLTKLFDLLEVPIQKSNMSFAVSVNGGEFEYGSSSMGAFFSYPTHFLKPAFWGLLLDILTFYRTASKDTASDQNISVEELIRRRNFGEWFEKYYLLPMSGAIWSTPRSEMLKFPANLLVKFFEHHGLLSLTGQHQWWTVSGGSKNYVHKLMAQTKANVRLNAPVRAVKRGPEGISVKAKGQEVETFDHVIFACHSNDALEILKDANAEEHFVLSSIPYRSNRIILHQDTSLMPKRKACWASWVYLTNTKGDEEQASVTYWMNSLQAIPMKTPLFATLNPNKTIPEESIFAEHIFEHPQYDHRAVQAHENLPNIQGRSNTWFCGAWAGMGFHEDGFQSAIKVARMMGVNPPWN
ncbi:MAG: FAD-dependent oxidoreductase [Rhodobacteraceae bacterium]|nr:FAD-dependent oxidoreductase [Paracoccaceae bacterium]MCY4250900.1 FAD-dependent oxidoreductase [Paracoccaceae bacterium]